MSNEILTERDGEVTAITLNRPDAGNGMTNDMAVELTGIIDEAGTSSHYIVLRGAGEDFCTGRAGMGQAPAERPEALDLRNQNEIVFNCYGAFRRSPAPIVGVVQGRALGFGCALAALCDITIASDQAMFQLPEMGHNIMPTMAMSSLVDRVTRKGVMYLTYSTKQVSAERALSFGIVSDIASHAGLEDAVATLRAALDKAPRPAILAVKEYARNAITMDLQGAVDLARNLHATVNSSSGMRG